MLKKNILCVDDEPIILDLLTDILRSAGYDVKAVSSAEEALVVARDREQRVDLVITDIVMPGMNGIQFVEQFQKIRPDIEVIGMSAYASEATIERMEKMEVYDFIRKPLHIEELLGLVAQGLESHRTARIRRHLNESADPRRARGRILVIDDSVEFLRLAKTLLTHEGYLVDVAETGNEGLEKIYVGTYDIVLLDIVMPHMDGKETARKIMSYDPHLYVVMITGMADSVTVKEAETLTETRVLRKPLDIELFKKTIKELDFKVRRHQREQERIERVKDAISNRSARDRIKDWLLYKKFEYHVSVRTVLLILVLSIIFGMLSSIALEFFLNR